MQKVAAGFPSPAQDYIDKTLDMNEFLIQNQQATFIVGVESLSMRDAGIDLQDKLIVDLNVVFLLDKMSYFCYFEREQ